MRALDEELDTGDAKFFQVIEQLNSQKYGDLKRAGRELFGTSLW